MTGYASAALAAYRTSQKLDQRPAAVLAAAHQELTVEIGAAIAAYRAGALDQMCRRSERAAQLLGALIAALQASSPETDALVRDYVRLRKSLNRLLFEPIEMETLQLGVDWLRTLTRLFRTEL